MSRTPAGLESPTVDGADRPKRRFPRRVFEAGIEPDPRFSLANERTFLAWVRTALALTAGGVALMAVSVGINGNMRLAAATMLLVAGVALPLGAWVTWMRNERALRQAGALSSPALGLPLACVVSITAVLLITGVINR